MNDKRKELEENPYEFRPLGKPISNDQAGQRLDQHLSKYFLFRSRSQWQKTIRSNEMHVNTLPIKKSSYELKEGDRLSYLCPKSEEPPVDKGIKVVWESSDIIAVYKPSNLPMHEGGAYRHNTFSQIIKEELGPEWSAVHRLDRETSGIVLCAANQTTRSLLSEVIRSRKIEKRYFAITFGVPEQKKWHVDAPIGALQSTVFRTKQWVTEEGQSSQTDFECVASKGNISLFKVRPITGRTHQIRVHASWSGFPLVGDKKYHPDESIYLEYLEKGFTQRVQEACLFERLCLHATFLRFEHPLTKTICEIDCPIPSDMQAIWDSFA